MPRRGELVDWKIPHLGPWGWVTPLCGGGGGVRIFPRSQTSDRSATKHRRYKLEAAPVTHFSSPVARERTTRRSNNQDLISAFTPIWVQLEFLPFASRYFTIYLYIYSWKFWLNALSAISTTTGFSRRRFRWVNKRWRSEGIVFYL